VASAECPHCLQPIVVDVDSTAFAVGTCPNCGGTLQTDATLAARGDAGKNTIVQDSAPRKAAGHDDLDLLVGAVLGGCRIETPLGRGAMGVVYRARQLSLDRGVAVKVIRPELCSDPNLLQRFQREAKMIGSFSTQHVVQVHDVGAEGGYHFLVMELVEGGNLLSRVAQLPNGRLPPDEAIAFLIEAAEGLREAERLGIIHRDIKPENLLVDSSDRLKIADFGISRSLQADVSLTRTEMVIGTPLYMSPEQCRGEKVDARTDMYALGATFCHLLAGRPPLRENSVPELLRRKTTIESLSPRKLADDGTIPESLSRVIERMTALDRDDRYADFAELLEDLRRVERGEVIAPYERRSARKRRARRIAWGIAASLTLAGLYLAGDWGLREWNRRQAPVDVGVGAVTAAQLHERIADLRKSIAEKPELVNLNMAEQARRLAGRATDSPKESSELRELGDDAERLASFFTSTGQLGAPRFVAPFAELEEHVNGLRRMAEQATRDRKNRDLRASIDREVTRRVGTLATRSKDELSKAALALETRVGASAQDADSIAASRRDRQAVAEGLAVLERLFPEVKGDFAAVLPKERLEKVDRALQQAETDAGKVTDEAARELLADLENRFRAGGPKGYAFLDAMKVRDRLRRDSPAKPEFDSFADLLSRGEKALDRLDGLRTEKPKVDAPFDELAQFAGKCRRAVEPLEPDWYAEFFRAELVKRLAVELEPARAAYAALVKDAKGARAGLAGGGDPDAALGLFEKLATAQKNLGELYPDLKPEWDAALPAAELAAAQSEVEQRAGQKKASMAGSQSLDELKRSLDGVRSSGDWRGAQADVERLLAAARDKLKAASNGAGAGGNDVDRRFTELEKRVTTWTSHVAALDGALELVGGARHDLASAGAALDKLADDGLADPAAADAKSAVESLASAFRALFETMSPRAAADAFKEAAGRLPAGSAARKYAEACRQRQGQLQEAVGSAMASVAAGRVQPAGASSPIDVGGFFLDGCEVSIGEFRAFLDSLKADRARWEPLVAELPGLKGADAETVPRRLLATPECCADASPANGRLPVRQVGYDQALLFARLRSKDLPTFEEWFLAAKGSLSRNAHRRFPCSDNPSLKLREVTSKESLVWGRKAPVAVDLGGDVAGFPSGTMRHLSGNVEELTLAVAVAASGRFEARVVGGGYTDGVEQEELFAGERVRTLDPREVPERPIGFRTVLRPRDFFAAAGLAPAH